MSCLPKITLNYSIDGTNFAPAGLAIELEIHNIFLDPMLEDLGARDSGKLAQRSNPHIRIEIGTTWDIFDPGGTGSTKAIDNWNFLQNWIAAPIRRIAWDTSLYTDWGGYDVFNSASNTNYVIIEDYEPEYEPSDLDVDSGIVNKKLVKIAALVATKYTLTLVDLS